MRHALKHHWTRHKHHLGLWALFGLILLASTWWLKSLLPVPAINPEPSLPTVSAQSTSSPQTIKSASVNNASKEKLDDKSPVTSSSPFTASSTASSTPSVAGQQAMFANVPDKSLINVIFEFVAPPGAASTFTARVKDNANVYEAMQALALVAPIQFEFKEYAGLGAMLIAVNGVANDARAQKFWIYYRNGAPAPVGVSSLRVTTGDVITWRYE